MFWKISLNFSSIKNFLGVAPEFRKSQKCKKKNQFFLYQNYFYIGMYVVKIIALKYQLKYEFLKVGQKFWRFFSRSYLTFLNINILA